MTSKFPVPDNQKYDVLDTIFVNKIQREQVRIWHQEKFCFHHPTSPQLRQQYGGPCGVLAVIQARIIKKVIFEADVYGLEFFEPGADPNEVFLILAIAETLWLVAKARKRTGEPMAVFFTRKNKQWYRHTAFSEAAIIKTLRDEQIDFNYRAILLISSVLATSQHLERNLLTEHSDCDQVLVTLLITGQICYTLADYCEGDPFEGLREQPDVGFLPQRRVAQELGLGSFLKNPKYPIWVINCSHHYTVVYSEKSAVMRNVAGNAYKLYYLDQLRAKVPLPLMMELPGAAHKLRSTTYPIDQNLRLLWPKCDLRIQLEEFQRPRKRRNATDFKQIDLEYR